MPETTPPPDHESSRRRPALFFVAILAFVAAVAVAAAVRDAGWMTPSDGEHASSNAPASRADRSLSSGILPPLFAVDSRMRRAGVASWMNQLRGESTTALAAQTLPVPYDPARSVSLDSTSTFGGVDYADVTDSGIPLQWVGDDTDAWLSPGLRLRDFVTHDGAPFVRIDPDFVHRLESLRRRAGELLIVSGYRHPAYNVNVGGHAESYHTAGQAADVWSPKYSSLELANMALSEMGCDIGIGLNEHTIHVDIRGELTSWTYPDAPISESAFDAWTLVQCGQPVPSWLSQAAAEAWLDESLDPSLGGQDETSDMEDAPGSMDARPSAERLLAMHASAIAEKIEQGRSTVGAGGVVLEFEPGSAPSIRYVTTSSAEADALGLPPLIAWCASRGSAYVAYAVILPDETSVGVSNELVIGGNAPTRAVSPSADLRPTSSSRIPASNASGSDRPASPSNPAQTRATQDEGWVVFAGSFDDIADAEARASSLGQQLDVRVFVVEAPQIQRYRVAVGPFATSRAATLARESFGDEIAVDAWIAPL